MNYKGFVEYIYDGMAFLILEDEDSQTFYIEWDATELSQWNIWEREPFTVKVVQTGDDVLYEFTPDQPKQISDKISSEIESLKKHYGC